MKKLLLLLFITLSLSKGIAQTSTSAKGLEASNPVIDSLQKVLKTTIHDTTRINTLNALTRKIINTGDYEQAMKYANDAIKMIEMPSFEKMASLKVWLLKALAQSYNNIGIIHWNKGDYAQALEFYFKSLKISEDIGDKKGIAKGYHGIGIIHWNKGDYAQAIEFYFKALKIYEEIGDKKGMSASYNNIGAIQHSKGDYAQAIAFYFKSLKIDEELGNKQAMASTYNNIGNVHKEKGDCDQAMEFHFKSLKIREEIGDKKGMADSYGNIGIIHAEKGDYAQAIEFYFKDLKIREEIGDKQGMATSYNNIGIIHKEKGDYAQAIEFYFKALKIEEEIGDKKGMALAYNSIGNLYLKENKPEEAKKQSLKSLSIAKEIDALPDMMYAYNVLARADSALGNFKEAYADYKLYTEAKDSIFSEEANKKAIQSEMTFEFEKKEAVAKAEQEKKDALAREELQQQKMQRNGFIAGFALMLALAGVSYRSFRNKRKANMQLAIKNTLIEEKQKEILDSINYAKRIQNAILPPNRIVKEHLPESFILYKPKDIVAGDFYWLEHKNGKVLFAAADCTGHGVPGAMVSVICNNGLNRSVREHGIIDPGKILDKTREIVISEFEKSDDEVKDGMDISLCALSPSPRGQGEVLLQWAGANNPLWVIRNNEIIEIKPNKQPIGKYAENKPFTTHSMELQKNDALYLFTDGYADQFGGEKGKKFKFSKLKELLLSIADKSMNEQKEILNENFETWKGNLEQVDDVCVIGVRI